MNKVREGYKMTELGEIPSDWMVDKLGSFVTIKARIGWRGLKATEYTESGPFLIAGKHIKGAKILWEACDHLSMERYDESPEIQLRDKDVIISKDGTIGRVAFIDKLPGLATINGTMMLLRVNNPAIEPNFLYFFLQGHYFQKIIKEKISGSSVPHLFQRDMDSLKIPIFNVEEQKNIAAILSKVDEQIDENKQLIVKTKELKKGLMQQLLTKGIGHTLFKQTELGEIPAEWEIVSLKDISEFITKGSTPTTYGFDWEESGVYFFKSDVVKEGKFVYGDYKFISPEAHKQMSRSIIKAGDILISITGNVGRVAIVPEEIKEANMNQHIARIRVNKENVYSQFIFQWLNQNKLVKYYELIKTGLAYPQISLAQVRNTLIPIPSPQEQQKIASILSTVDEQIEVYEQEKAKYEELKKGLMQQLLTGQIRVKK